MSDAAERPTEISDAYSAREAYKDYDVGAQYEKLRFSGAMGRYRRKAELRAVDMALEAVDHGSTILDCPCGIGRWWPTLAPKAGKLIAVDISEGMLTHARERAERDRPRGRTDQGRRRVAAAGRWLGRLGLLVRAHEAPADARAVSGDARVGPCGAQGRDLDFRRLHPPHVRVLAPAKASTARSRSSPSSWTRSLRRRASSCS